MPFYADNRIPIPTKDVISWYFDNPKFAHDQPVYIDALDVSRCYTANQAKSAIRKLVAGFHAAGLRKGDCVCIHGFNDINVSILANGIVAAGGIFTGTNPSYSSYELLHHIRTGRIRFFITEEKMLNNVVSAMNEAGLPNEHIFILDKPGDKVPLGFKSWSSLLEYGEKDWIRFDDLETSKNTPIARMFSSGTTGLPKAADLSHYNIIAQHTILEIWMPRPYKVRRLQARPHFHVATTPQLHFSPLRDGAQNFVLRRFDLDTYLRLIEKHQITDTSFAPPIVSQLINSPLQHKYSLESVRNATCGSAPLNKTSQRRLQALLGRDVPFTQIYGMTEASCIAMTVPYPEQDLTGSVGRPLPGMDVKIIDDSGKDITDYGIQGEICMRGECIIKGYYNNEPATTSSIDRDGYFHSGDIGYCDSKTRLFYLVDRKKELIKVRGFQVAPTELEAVLMDHPLIVETAVIGVKFPPGDSELPRAYIVKRDCEEAAALSMEEVKTFVANKLAKYKRLDGGVVFLDALPKVATGKVEKKKLKAMALREIGAKL